MNLVEISKMITDSKHTIDVVAFKHKRLPEDMVIVALKINGIVFDQYYLFSRIEKVIKTQWVHTLEHLTSNAYDLEFVDDLDIQEEILLQFVTYMWNASHRKKPRINNNVRVKSEVNDKPKELPAKLVKSVKQNTKAKKKSKNTTKPKSGSHEYPMPFKGSSFHYGWKSTSTLAKNELNGMFGIRAMMTVDGKVIFRVKFPLSDVGLINSIFIRDKAIRSMENPNLSKLQLADEDYFYIESTNAATWVRDTGYVSGVDYYRYVRNRMYTLANLPANKTINASVYPPNPSLPAKPTTAEQVAAINAVDPKKRVHYYLSDDDTVPEMSEIHENDNFIDVVPETEQDSIDSQNAVDADPNAQEDSPVGEIEDAIDTDNDSDSDIKYVAAACEAHNVPFHKISHNIDKAKLIFEKLGAVLSGDHSIPENVDITHLGIRPKGISDSEFVTLNRVNGVIWKLSAIAEILGHSIAIDPLKFNKGSIAVYSRLKNDLTTIDENKKNGTNYPLTLPSSANPEHFGINSRIKTTSGNNPIVSASNINKCPLNDVGAYTALYLKDLQTLGEDLNDAGEPKGIRLNRPVMYLRPDRAFIKILGVELLLKVAKIKSGYVDGVIDLYSEHIIREYCLKVFNMEISHPYIIILLINGTIYHQFTEEATLPVEEYDDNNPVHKKLMDDVLAVSPSDRRGYFSINDGL